MTVIREQAPAAELPASWLTVPWPDRLLSLADWDALPEHERYRRAEADEGVLVLSPGPRPSHQGVSLKLAVVLLAAMPPSLIVREAVDVLLVQTPLTVRQPDVVLVSREAVLRDPPRFATDDVLLAVEIVSPSSRSRDAVLKRHQYGAAGIPCYWIIDIEREPALIVCTGPQASGGYSHVAEYGRDEAAELTLPGVDTPVRVSVADLLGV